MTTGSILDIVFSQQGTSAKFSVEPTQSYRLTELASAVDFVLACKKGSQLMLTSQKGLISKVEVEDEINHGQELREYSFRSNKLRAFLDLVGFRDEVTVCPRNLFHPPDNFQWLCAALDPDSKVQTRIADKKARWKGDGLFANVVVVRINEQDLFCFFYWQAEYAIAKGRTVAKIRNPQCFDTILAEGNNSRELKEGYEAFEVFCKEASNGNLMIRSISEEDEEGTRETKS